MDDAAASTADIAQRLSGSKIIDAIKAARIDYVLSVPDLHTREGLLHPIAEDAGSETGPGLQGGRDARHRGGSALRKPAFADPRPVHGLPLFDQRDPRRRDGQKLPIVMMVGMLGKEPGVAPKESRRYGVRIVARDLRGDGNQICRHRKR